MPYNIGDILLDKYRIEEIIGKGAFGEVYRVMHLKLNAARAIKVLRKDAPGLGSTEYGEYQDRFKLEAQLGAKLNHPNIIQVHDFEMNGEDLLLVMEYAAGGNLSKRIEQAKQSGTPMPLGTALTIAEEVAGGLAKLHEMDVVHRDLKPSNILFDEKGHAKVADLGLAQVPGGPSMRSQLSTPALHPGTPAYMSPEQKNSRDYLTPPSDVYALGLVLFEMLTGRVYRSQPPGTRIDSMRDNIPEWLDDLLASMLSEKPENRPWNGNAVLPKLHDRLPLKEEKQKAERSQKLAGGLVGEVVLEKAERERKPALSANFRFLGVGGIIVIVLILSVYWINYFTHLPTTPKPFLTAQATFTFELPTATHELPTETSISSTPSLVPQGGSLQVSPMDQMTMIYIPEGSFLMGTDPSDAMTECRKFFTNCVRDWFLSEAPPHHVNLSAFWIDRTEITNGMYALCVSAGACTHPHGSNSNTRDGYTDDPQYADYPVIYVTWYDAQDYCKWAGRRLPTEADWEKAARGVNGSMYPWGNGAPNSQLLNYDSEVKDTTTVGSYPQGASSYGVLDMAGNVWEWVADWYGETYYATSPVDNPSGPASGTQRVNRGGSWAGDVGDVRSAHRNKDAPDWSSYELGFRCAANTP